MLCRNPCTCQHFELQKELRDPGASTVLTSKSLSCHNAVQILATSWAADPPNPPAFRSWLCEPAKPQKYGKIEHFAQFLPAKAISSHTSVLYKICAVTSLCWQILRSNSQYSRKLPLIIIFWPTSALVSLILSKNSWAMTRGGSRLGGSPRRLFLGEGSPRTRRCVDASKASENSSEKWQLEL